MRDTPRASPGLPVPLALALVLGLALAGPAPVPADRSEPASESPLPPPTLHGAALVGALHQGGHVIFVRHALTNLDQEDADPEDLDDCATQRNLSAEGRRQARDIGQAFARLRIPVTEVLSSPYCRCRDTATLAFGRTTVAPFLYFAIGVAPEKRDRMAQRLRTTLATPPPAAGNRVIVSHTANLMEAANIWPKPEGVAVIFKPVPPEGFEYVAAVLPDEWATLGAEPPR